VLTRLRSTDAEGRRWAVAGVVVAAVAVVILVSSPGNDLDVANVFRSGRAIARHATYVPSRPPGAPVHEATTGILDLLGGPILTGLASLAAAAATLLLLERLLADSGVGRTRRWAVAVVGLNPWFLVAATSTADYVFALAFSLGAALAVRRRHPVLAGLLAAAAMGSRVGSITLLLAIAAAELTGAPDEREGRERRDADQQGSATRSSRGRQLLIATGVAAAGTVVLFVPSVLAAGGLDFARNDFSASSPLVQLGRTAAKDVLLLGIPTTVLVLAALPSLVVALRRWSDSWAVRFATVGLLGSQLLFLRFPWKMAHLLPSLVCLAVLLAVALEDRVRWLMAIVALQVLFSVVRVDVLAPDDAGQAGGARIEPTITWGPLVTDWQCRREHPTAYLGRQKYEVETAWECAAPFAD
jgi:hypothetical protein